ncbi:MAG TPA: hypothetical protein VGC92_01615 [Phenylobacterium sp.]|jgi:predicted Zn-dependent protease
MRRTLMTALIAGGLAMSTASAALAEHNNGYHDSDPTAGDPFSLSPVPGAQRPGAELAKAIRALRIKDYRYAANAADNVLQASPGSVYAWQLLGVSLAGRADWRGSGRAYARAVRLSPDNPVNHAGLGLALANQKDPAARAELDWLQARARACGDGCPDSARLKALASTVQNAL